MKTPEKNTPEPVVDKTEQLRWNLALQEAEDHFRLIADAAPVLIWRAGTDKLCFWFNKVWLKFTGRTMEQEYGNGWAEGVHPDDLQHCLAIYIGHFDDRMPFSMEYRLKRSDGEYRWLLDNGVPIHDAQNTFIGYIGSCIDITDRINAEAELKRSNADLQRFAEVTAHHLQEPARRIASYSERLKSQLTGKLENAEAQLSLNFINTNARHLQDMLGDVELYLAAAQPIGASLSINVRDLLRKKLVEMERRIEEAHATVNLGELPEVHIDSSRLDTVLSIALDNALTHAQSTISLKLTISGERVGNRVIYRISDNGVGIEEQYRERVFRVFERISAKATGSGIGLSILRRIAESTGGRAWIEETTGGGCTVIIDLPSGEK